MSGANAPTQPDQAEGERGEEPAASKGGGQGVSSQEPAEGGDDKPGRDAGSPSG